MRPATSAVLLAIVLALPGAGSMAASSSSSSSSQDVAAKLDRAERMIESGRARDAIPILNDVVSADSDNADAYNFMGLAYRRLGKYEQSRSNYEKALNLDPEHKGALEYLGELYLKLGQPAKAEEQLARLDEICAYGCEEYDELSRAIKDYRESN